MMKMNNDDIVYFWLNDWDYPEEEPYLSWMLGEKDNKSVFQDEDWVKANKLCVILVPYIMDIYFFITAKREWVEKNCPSILTEYSDYIRTPDENGEVPDPICGRYKTYCEENIGITIQDGYLK